MVLNLNNHAVLTNDSLNPGAVASCTEYTHHEKCRLVVYSGSVASLQVVKDANARGLRTDSADKAYRIHSADCANKEDCAESAERENRTDRSGSYQKEAA